MKSMSGSKEDIELGLRLMRVFIRLRPDQKLAVVEYAENVEQKAGAVLQFEKRNEKPSKS